MDSSGIFTKAIIDFEFLRQNIYENSNFLTLKIQLNRILIRNENNSFDLFTREGDMVKIIIIQKEQTSPQHRGLNQTPGNTPENTSGFHYYFISDFLNEITIINSVSSSLKRIPVKHTTERNIMEQIILVILLIWYRIIFILSIQVA